MKSRTAYSPPSCGIRKMKRSCFGSKHFPQPAGDFIENHEESKLKVNDWLLLHSSVFNEVSINRTPPTCIGGGGIGCTGTWGATFIWLFFLAGLGRCCIDDVIFSPKWCKASEKAQLNTENRSTDSSSISVTIDQ